VTELRQSKEWPLAIFTLALQLACGIAIATTVAAAYSPAQSVLRRTLGSAVFPLVALGLAVSLAHLGRPLSAWRALSNIGNSRLSLEVLLTSAFAVSSLAYSFLEWTSTTALRFPIGAITSILGIAAVIASAAIYRIPTRPIWDSGWVIASFAGSTVMVAGLALASLWTPTRPAIFIVLSGCALLFLSGARMWSRCFQFPPHPNLLHMWFAGYLLLVVLGPVLLTIMPVNGAPLACCAAVTGIFAGRMLMFAVAELEPRF